MDSELADGWNVENVGSLTENLDRHRVPLSGAERAVRSGPYPYWGANGPIDSIDDYLFEGPHVLIAEDGTVVDARGRGTVHWISGGRFWVNNHAHVLRAAPGVSLRWLYFALSQVEIRPFVTGSVQPKLSQRNLNSIQLPAPGYEEQQRIAIVLGALDDKMDSNRRLADRLGAVAGAVFRARFIEFLGVKEFEQTEIGRIPRGWKELPFSEAIDVNPRVQLRKGVTAPHIEMAAMPRWALRPTRITERSYAGGARFERGDTLMARITGCIEHGKGAFVDFLDGPASGSTEFLVLRAKPPLTPEAVFLLSRDDRVRSHAIANMTGSSGRQRVPVSAFDDLEIAVPPDLGSWQDDAAFLRVAFEQTRALWGESQTLEGIRDSLLPKLISGEIRVPDTADVDEALAAVGGISA